MKRLCSLERVLSDRGGGVNERVVNSSGCEQELNAVNGGAVPGKEKKNKNKNQIKKSRKTTFKGHCFFYPELLCQVCRQPKRGNKLWKRCRPAVCIPNCATLKGTHYRVVKSCRLFISTPLPRSATLTTQFFFGQLPFNLTVISESLCFHFRSKY